MIFDLTVSKSVARLVEDPMDRCQSRAQTTSLKEVFGIAAAVLRGVQQMNG